MKAVSSLEELRSLLRLKVEREFLSCSLLPEGLPRGAITEISGLGKTEFTARFLSEYPTLRVAWIEENFSVFPFGFFQRNIDLSRLLFVEAQEQMEWVTLQVLKAQIFSVVVLYKESFDLKALRRIQIASEKSHALTLWLTHEPQASWPVSVQLHVRRDEEVFQIHVLKRRF